MNTDVRIEESRSCYTRWINRIPSNVLVGFFLLKVCMFPSSFTLDSLKTISQYRHTAWGIEEELPQIVVQCIIQTHNGYLWLGTQKGLVRFDGAHFIEMSTNPKNDRTHKWITPLYIMTIKTIIINEGLSNSVKG